MKYRKILPGAPYVKDTGPFKGFVPGVGYLKNLTVQNPVWSVCGILLAVSGTILTALAYRESRQHPDMQLMYHDSYKVRRREDVDDMTRECYN